MSSFLFDGNCRTKASNKVNIRLVHAAKKLAGIGRKAFHITALAFGKKSIKSKGRFSRTRKARNCHKLVARNFYRNILKVMLAGTLYANFITVKNIHDNHYIERNK